MAFPSKEKGRGVFAALKASGWESVRLVLSQYWVRLIGLNLLYLLCCLPVITIPAATCGLHRVILNMVRETRYEGVFHGFFAEFRTHFLKRTVFGLLLLLAPVSIACYPIIFGMEGSAVVIATTISVLLYFCITKYFYPLLVLLDVFLVTMFGTALSSCINFFLTTDGQASAVGTIVSAGYGFVCGAYMPISSFGSGLQKALSFLPGTYGTALLRNHMLRGVFAEMSAQGFPAAAIDAIRDGLDCSLRFFGAAVSQSAMYAVLCGSVAALIGLRSTRAMLLLARALYLLEIPFFGFLLDCKVTTAQCTIIAFLYDRCRDCPPEELPEGQPHRFGGWPLLTAAVAGVTLATGLMAVYLYTLPQDDALLTAVGGVTPLVTFHRGDCTVAPENTLPAFRSAILKGGDRIELDVQMTSDGVVVVTHDSNLKRCTGKNAKVYDLTYAEVAQLDAGRWFSSRFADTRIPTLEQVLQLCRGRIGLNVEIKPSAATPALEAETVRLLREYGFDSSNCVITSQSYETLHKVKALAPEYPTGYILALGVGNYYDLPDADFFSVETTFITSGMVNAVHLRGKTVSAWTIDREKVATHMLELGVDDLITDKPDMVQDLLARNQQVDDSLIDFRDLLNALLHPEQPADSSDDAEEAITDAVEDPEEFVDAA